MGVNSLPKTVTRQRRDCDLNPGPTAPESSTLTSRLLSHQTEHQTDGKVRCLRLPYLASPSTESTHGALYVLLLFLISYLFFTIPVRPFISKSTGPIFAKFSCLVELWL